MLEMGRFADFLSPSLGDPSESSSTKHSLPDTTIFKLQKAVLPWLFLISLLKVLDQGDEPMKMPSFAEDLNLHDLDTLAGDIVFFLGALLFMIPSTLLQAKIGNIKWLSYLVGGIGVAALLMATVHGADALIVMRFLIGLIAAGITPGLYIFMASLFTHHELTMGVAIVTAGRVLGQALQKPLTSGFLNTESFGFVRGWQWMFVLFGIITIVFAAAFWNLLPKEIAGFRLLTAEEREWFEGRQDAISRIASRRARQNGSAYAPFITWRMYRLCVQYMLVQCILTALLYFYPLYLRMILSRVYLDTPVDDLLDKHLAPAGLLAAGLHVPAMLGVLALGWHSYKHGERKMHVAVPLLVGALPIALTPAVTTRLGPAAGYVMLVLAILPLCAVSGPIISWVAALFHGRALLTAFPMLLLFGAFGELWLGPIFVQGFAAVQAQGVSNVLIMLSILQFVTGLLFLGSKAGEVVPAEPVEAPIVPAEDLESFLPPRQAQE